MHERVEKYVFQYAQEYVIICFTIFVLFMAVKNIYRRGKTMKKSVKRVAVILTAALAFVFVLALSMITAKAAVKELYTSEGVRVSGGIEKRITFSIGENEDVKIMVLAVQPYAADFALYDAAGTVLARNFEDNGDFWYDTSTGLFYVLLPPFGQLPAGEYTFAVKSSLDNAIAFAVLDNSTPKILVGGIDPENATLIVGCTEQLSVEDETVNMWVSSDPDVAEVDAKGNVTVKKAGKVVITAVLIDGSIQREITVVSNKYTADKLSVEKVKKGTTAMRVYDAHFDQKGNLVIKARYVNRTSRKVAGLKNIKIVVKDANGKTVGTYNSSKMKVSVKNNAKADLTFTISKSKLKQKNVDLSKCKFQCKNGSIFAK